MLSDSSLNVITETPHLKVVNNALDLKHLHDMITIEIVNWNDRFTLVDFCTGPLKCDFPLFQRGRPKEVLGFFINNKQDDEPCP